jgi:hypothetical protein
MERVKFQRTAKITIEIDSLMVIRQAGTERAWCPRCRAQVDAISLINGGLREQGAAAQILAWLRTDELHGWELPDGSPKICLPSLLRCFESDALPTIQPKKESL